MPVTGGGVGVTPQQTPTPEPLTGPTEAIPEDLSGWDIPEPPRVDTTNGYAHTATPPQDAVDTAIRPDVSSPSVGQFLIAQEFWAATQPAEVQTLIAQIFRGVGQASTPNVLSALVAAIVGTVATDIPPGSWNVAIYDLTLKMQTELLIAGMQKGGEG